ncbi:MAG: copper resistance CopC family protein [Actinomycetota bacterium]
MHRTGRRPPALTAPALLLAAGIAAAGVATAGPAGAHDELASSTPGDATTVTAPTRVVLRFGEPVLTLGLVVAVTGPGGDAGSGRPSVAGATVTQALRSPAPPGRYTTVWRAVSSDSHPVSGTFTFTVDGPTTPTATSSAPSPTTPVAATPAASAAGTTGGTVGAAPATTGGGRGLAIAGGALALLLAAATLATRRARR